MNTTRLLSTALLVTSIPLTVAAQERPAAAASAAMAGATMPHDCARPLAKHDHGVEKGTPTPTAKAKPCVPAATASAPEAKPMPKPGHAMPHKHH